VVETQEGGDRPYPLLDGTTKHDPAGVGDIVADQDVQVLEIPREQHPSSNPTHGHTARALVGRVDVVFPIRIVELRGAPPDDDVGVGLFPVVDARLLDWRPPGRGRRNVQEIEDRQPFAALAGHRAHDHTVAVRERHVAVDPGLGVGGKQRGLELARRQHHLLIDAVEPVAIHVHVMKAVIGPDLLQLRIGIHQRLPVPQPDVVDRRLVGLQGLDGEVLLRRE
jgi:hypothetical protein